MKLLTILIAMLISISVQSQIISAKNDSSSLPKQYFEAKNSIQVIDSAINYGKTLIGRPYKYGGSTLKGFDCSGFIRFIFQKYGYSFPHSSRAYAQVGTKINNDSILTLKKGDILLFKGRNQKSKRIGHVAIVIKANDNEILMLHSCCDKGIAIENYLSSAYYPKRLVEIRRL